MTTPRTGDVAHIAINADDPDSARSFYESLFGWRFEAWGPPGFYRAGRPDGGPPGPIVVLQGRRTFDDGTGAAAEITVAVDDVAAVCAAARTAGGRVLMDPTAIAGAGELAFLADPSGTPVGVMRYDPRAE